MISDFRNYGLFFKFIEKFSSACFKDIDPNDELMIEMEDMMEKNNQFFSMIDATFLNYIFTSKRSSTMIGIEPAEVNPTSKMQKVHPDDLYRYNLGRKKLMSMHMDLFIAEKGSSLVSTNIRMQNPGRGYSDYLIQCYMFYSSVPDKSVYLLNIQTNIDHLKKQIRNIHYYYGNDLSYFKYPDEELLQNGMPFSSREFDIIKLINLCMTKEEIADKLFISVHTVNTHVRNILDKSDKNRISDVIYDLIKQGLI